MIEGCLRALLFISGDALLSLIYGKAKNILIRIKALFFDVMRWILTICSFCWLMSFLFLDSKSSEFPFILSYLIGYPVVIAVWTLIARKKYKSYSLAYSLSNGKNLEKNTNESKASPIVQQNSVNNKEAEAYDTNSASSPKSSSDENKLHVCISFTPTGSLEYALDNYRKDNNRDNLAEEINNIIFTSIDQLEEFPLFKKNLTNILVINVSAVVLLSNMIRELDISRALANQASIYLQRQNYSEWYISKSADKSSKFINEKLGLINSLLKSEFSITTSEVYKDDKYISRYVEHIIQVVFSSSYDKSLYDALMRTYKNICELQRAYDEYGKMEKESINNHATTPAKANDHEKGVHTVTEQPAVIDEQPKTTDTLKKDRADCLALKEELKKFPVAKIKQWHADGKITDEQYKAAAKKFNAIKKEIQDIEERIAFIESLESHDVQ